MAVASVFALGLVVEATAATITVVNMDGAGEGFNDPTPVAPVGGNPGTTLGAQRLNAFQAAANIWGGLLVSGVPILIDATMDPLFCSASSAVLGQAGPTTVHRDFPGALVASTWYPQALANKLRGSDLAPGTDDIVAQFNSSIGTTCTFPRVWYYGLDASPPGSEIDFETVVLHEIGHGLGFLTLVDDTSGAKFQGLDDVFMRNLEDHSLGLLWPPMTDAQRQASAIDTGDLHWTGGSVVAAGGFLTSGRDPGSGHVRMFAPNPVQPGSSVSHWDTVLSPNQLLEPVYTGPIHDPSLTRNAMTDIGWGSAAPATTTSTSSSSTTSTTGATTSTSTTLVGGPTTSTSTTPTSGTTSTSTASPTTSSTTLPVAACGPAPATGCRLAAPGRASLRVLQKTDVTRDQLKWMWKHGAATAVADFKDPLGGSAPTIHVCLYDASATAQPLLLAAVLPGGTCAGRPCWKTTGTSGFRYRNNAGSPDGITDVKLKAGPTGSAQVSIRAAGSNVPGLPLTVPVTVQLLIGDGSGTECWQTTFSNAAKNDGTNFKATGP